MRECGLGACTADFAEFLEGLVAWKHALFCSLPNSFAIFCSHHTDMCREDDAALPTSSAFSAKH
jgi:hypothetical protein